MKPESLTTAADELIPCISCLAENRRFESFCHRCGAPVSTTATLAPVQTIQTEGFQSEKLHYSMLLTENFRRRTGFTGLTRLILQVLSILKSWQTDLPVRRFYS
jgi:hypothetical protein